MRIAVNTRLLLKGKLEGIGWFTYENLKRIVNAHPEHEFFFLFDRPYSQDFIFADNVTPVVLFPQARHPFLYFLWFELSVKFALKRIKPDLFISPDGYLSLGTTIKTLLVFHDLNFEHYPGDLPLMERWYYRTFFPRFARKADRIATVSEFSKQDIMALYNIPASMIDVVYNGANEIYKPLDAEKIKLTRQTHAGGYPYLFFIGSLHPRKNLVNLFKAFDMYRDTRPTPVKLVITGARKWWTKEIETVYNSMKYRDEVIFTGRLTLAEIHRVLGSALALTYVSYFEGFGIPIVEAFRCGTPVITANVTSMPEVADDAAITVDPFNPRAIADAMTRITDDQILREKLIQKGLLRAEEFTWDKSAERLWKSIEKVMGL
ncbi:MAG: glycosyltransferase family 1 protein [Lentimicrobiaceae bacterium]